MALLESRLQDMECAIGDADVTVCGPEGGGTHAGPNEAVLSIVKGIGRRCNYDNAERHLDSSGLFERALNFVITNEDIDALMEEHCK